MAWGRLLDWQRRGMRRLSWVSSSSVGDEDVGDGDDEE